MEYVIMKWSCPHFAYISQQITTYRCWLVLAVVGVSAHSCCQWLCALFTQMLCCAGT